ncbi:MAG: hypothetical protein IPJ04_13435 [Candidatus Eisenbacteria bacterium]|nr:hypothetical protein [Candidatus Eisenbacteria bacterium]
MTPAARSTTSSPSRRTPRFRARSSLADAAAAALSAPRRAAFAAATDPLVRHEGLLRTWTDARTGRVLIELPRPSGARGVRRVPCTEGIRTDSA